jgi:hypothetical protein
MQRTHQPHPELARVSAPVEGRTLLMQGAAAAFLVHQLAPVLADG